METQRGYFNDLNRLLAAMPPGMLDMAQIEANERHHGHRFYDPPETVYQWLLDQQRRAQAKLKSSVDRHGGPGTSGPILGC